MKMYFCEMRYYATGEGSLGGIAFILAKNKKQAKAEFCKRNIGIPNIAPEAFEQHIQGAINYYSPCIAVTEFNKKTKRLIKKQLEKYVTEPVINWLLDSEDNQALFHFNLNFYINYS